jgi:hypothetical protein
LTPEPALPKVGDSFLLTLGDGKLGFGVIRSVNLLRGVTLVTMQSGLTAELSLGMAVAAVDAWKVHQHERVDS